jgi:hypothetical protein
MIAYDGSAIAAKPVHQRSPPRGRGGGPYGHGGLELESLTEGSSSSALRHTEEHTDHNTAVQRCQYPLRTACVRACGARVYM